MRISELAVENYGIFHDQQWSLAPGFQVLFGPNEAGKSTLLQLLRELLFGFPHRSPYVFPSHAGEMAARATIDLSDGRQAVFRRRKGKQRTVQGEILPQGEPFDEGGLRQLLGGASLELYERVFAFSLADLAAGEAGLAHAELREALFGVSVGGMARFRTLQDELDQSIGDIYSSRARTRPRLNKLLAQISEAKQKLRDAAVRPAEYQRLVDAQQADKRRLIILRDQRERNQIDVDRLERLRHALPLQERLISLLRESQSLRIPVGFPHDGGEEFQRQSQRRGELLEELHHLQHESDNLQTDFESLAVRDDLLQCQHRLTRLFQQLTHCEQLTAEMPNVVRECQSLETEFQQLAGQLSDAGASFDLDAMGQHWVHAERLSELEIQDQQLREAAAKWESQRPQIVQERELLEQQRDATELVEDPAPWQQALDSQAELLQNIQRENDLQTQLSAARRKMSQREQQLASRLRDPAIDLARITVPFESLVKDFADQAAEFKRRQDECQRQQNELELALQEQRLLLRRIVDEQSVPDRPQLDAARRLRDQGWQWIRDHFIENIDRTQELAAWSHGLQTPAEALTAAIRQVDEIFERRQACAEKVALQEQYRFAIESLQHKQAAAADVRQALEKQRHNWNVEWQTVWHACHVEPQDPGTMLQWLELYADWSDQRENVASLTQQLQQVSAARSDRENVLRELVGDASSPVPDLLRHAALRLDQIRSRCQERDRIHKDLERRKQQVQELEHRLEDVATQRTEWQQEWTRLLGQLRLPLDWSVASVRTAVGLRQCLQEKHAALLAIQKKRQEMQGTLDGFDAEVAQLAAQLTTPSPQTPNTLELVRVLYAELQTTLLVDERKRRFDIERTRIAKLLENKERAIERIELRRKELMLLAQAEDEPAFVAIAHDASHAYQLAKQVAELRRQIDAALGNHDAEAFIAQLQDFDALAIEQRLADANREKQRLDEEYQLVVANLAVYDERLQKWSDDGRALEISTELESLRGKMRDLVDEWVPLVVAKSSMQLALERFEREHQPGLLADVNRIFSRMTHGRYTGVVRSMGDQPHLAVETARGERREVTQLSTGTREQLYLAVRIAFVNRYCRRAEPLPIVMDDVLVNFDDRRTAETLDVLTELGENYQVLFLTCHESTVNQVQTSLPNVTVHRFEQPAALVSR